ncbi:MAG: hypothetical protein IT439_01505 [Phycisphaerales bacterium]|nr:hypothetical protein [Phycisphaerales bacterium]
MTSRKAETRHERNPGTLGARIVAACTLAIVLATPALAAETRLGRDARVLALHRARALTSAVARVVRGIVEREEAPAEARPGAGASGEAPALILVHAEGRRTARLLLVTLLDLPPPAR